MMYCVWHRIQTSYKGETHVISQEKFSDFLPFAYKIYTPIGQWRWKRCTHSIIAFRYRKMSGKHSAPDIYTSLYLKKVCLRWQMVIFVRQFSCTTPYSNVVMSAMASQITGVSIVLATLCSGADQRKHQTSASLVFVREFTGDVNSPHKGPVTRKMFPFDDVIMDLQFCGGLAHKGHNLQMMFRNGRLYYLVHGLL